MIRFPFIFLGAFLLIADAGWSQSDVPVARAHAHNDYEHERPLFDALDQGFCSVEADIYLVGDELLVAHDVEQLRPERTLERLYLDPLRELTRKHNGHVFPKGPLFTLLIDIKSDGEQTYAVLDQVLERYGDMLCSTVDGENTRRAIQVVISGNRPKDTIAADRSRFAGIDGRLSDLNSDKEVHLMPLISDRWGSHFRWNGKGDIPLAERRKLESIVKQAHGAGRRLRFWATPESPPLWQLFIDLDVDHINTDQLSELAEFLRERDC